MCLTLGMLVNIFKSITVNITVRTTVNITINIFYIYQMQATMVEDQEFKNRIKVTSSAEFYLLKKHVCCMSSSANLLFPSIR